MRLQNLIIIFVVIALPVIIILSLYVRLQVDTVNLRTQFDSKFLGVSYDMLSALQLNMTNDLYSTVSDSMIRNIEASLNSFTTAVNRSIVTTGKSKESAMEFVPAVMFTMYDGYYIYTPTANTDGTYTHTLKPYAYYTKEYMSTDGNYRLVINYSLDNYVSVYYSDKAKKLCHSRSGFLEPIASSKNDIGIFLEGDNTYYYNGKLIEENETMYRNNFKYEASTGSYIVENDEPEVNQLAYDYCKKSYDFTLWYNDVINKINPSGKNKYGISYKTVLTITKDNQALPQSVSHFNDEKREIMQNTITNELKQTMENYKKKSGIDFQMPQFTPIEWEQIVQNICLITFIQGMPIGTATYNKYVVLPSTENDLYVSEKNLYYIGYGGDADNSYHRLGCEYLKGNEIIRI